MVEKEKARATEEIADEMVNQEEGDSLRDATGTTPTAPKSGMPSPASGSVPSPQIVDRTSQKGRSWVPSATRLEAQHPSGYTWRETDDEIEVSIPLPPDVSSSAQVDVEIRGDFVRVSVLGTERLAGALCGRLAQEESTWSLVPAEGNGKALLQLDLMKRTSGEIWGYILAHERAAASGLDDDDAGPVFDV